MFENHQHLHFSIHPSIFKIKTYDDSNSRIAEVVWGILGTVIDIGREFYRVSGSNAAARKTAKFEQRFFFPLVFFHNNIILIFSGVNTLSAYFYGYYEY